MSAQSIWYLFSVFFFLSLMSFYATQEMALISCNRLKLLAASRLGNEKAAWIQELLQKPTTLFGTTLIGVNFSLVVASESARQFFSSLGLNPNLSFLLLVPISITFGELMPMFSARMFPEHTARLGISFLRFSTKILSPLTSLLDRSFHLLQKLFFKEKNIPSPHLQRTELQELLEERKEGRFDTLVGQLFSLREKSAKELMRPLQKIPSLYATLTPEIAKEKLLDAKTSFALVRGRSEKVIGFINAWDLLQRVPRIQALVRHASFVSHQTKAIDLFFRMRQENSPFIFLINEEGKVIGAVFLEDLLFELLFVREERPLFIEKTVPSRMNILDFEKRFQITLPFHKAETFKELVEEILGHKPSKGETMQFGPLEITVKTISFLGAKTLLLKTV